MNTYDYNTEKETRCNLLFKISDKKTSRFDKKRREIQILIKTCVEQYIISQLVAKIMKPNNKPNRFYGVPKLHKQTAKGKRIPPCRPIVSNSGSNT